MQNSYRNRFYEDVRIRARDALWASLEHLDGGQKRWPVVLPRCEYTLWLGERFACNCLHTAHRNNVITVMHCHIPRFCVADWDLFAWRGKWIFTYLFVRSFCAHSVDGKGDETRWKAGLAALLHPSCGVIVWQMSHFPYTPGMEDGFPSSNRCTLLD